MLMLFDSAKDCEAAAREARRMERDPDAQSPRDDTPRPAMMQMSAPALLCLDDNNVVVNLPAGSIVTIRIPED